MPHILRERLQDKFTSLVQGSMLVSVYEMRFHMFGRHKVMIMPTEKERVHRFVRGLYFPIFDWLQSKQ